MEIYENYKVWMEKLHLFNLNEQGTWGYCFYDDMPSKIIEEGKKIEFQILKKCAYIISNKLYDLHKKFDDFLFDEDSSVYCLKEETKEYKKLRNKYLFLCKKDFDNPNLTTTEEKKLVVELHNKLLEYPYKYVVITFSIFLDKKSKDRIKEVKEMYKISQNNTDEELRYRVFRRRGFHNAFFFLLDGNINKELTELFKTREKLIYPIRTNIFNPRKGPADIYPIVGDFSYLYRIEFNTKFKNSYKEHYSVENFKKLTTEDYDQYINSLLNFNNRISYKYCSGA